jgi:hypothetical protein
MISLLAAAMLVATSAIAPPAKAGECKWVHGRYAVYNGAGVRRIWVIGTHRIIDLDNGDDIRAIVKYEQHPTDYEGKEDGLFGDFFVCAVENSRPGWMQLVHLVRTKNLIFRGKPFG